MGTLHTFPYSDPALVPASARVVRRISIPNRFGHFPITPFIGLELPAQIPVTERHSSPGLSRKVERMALEGCIQSPFQAPTPLPAIPDETHAFIGVGFYWWMKEEVGQEFFGYPVNSGIPAKHISLSRPRILRAFHALRQLSTIDLCHGANALSLCWSIARKEVEPQRVEKMIDLFGYEVVSDLQVRLRDYRPSAKELGALGDFLYKGRVRSSRIG